ncbi:FUSC family protein [Luteococcus sp. H138]|uniref:FUSC family protein n=1 Tax=unclassified Luteococcus TaxID=2639923 RepID=UPI00313B2266
MRHQLTRILNFLWPSRPAGRSEMLARLLPVIGNMARLAVASVLAFGLTRWLVSGPIDLTSALTALLVMQASAAGSFKMGLLRMVSVSSGVGIALVTASWLGMHWWSLGLVIFSALMLARILHLGNASLEMPISAMLILGSTQGDIAAETRIISTVIGAVVGILFPLVLPPAVPFRSASSAVRGVARAQQEVLHKAAEAMESGAVTKPMVSHWIDQARRVTEKISKAHSQVTELTDLRKFNSRAMGRADIAPILTSGLNSLESCLLSLRAIFLLMERHAPAPAHPSRGLTSADDEGLDREVQQAVAMMLRRLGDCLDAFGTMVEAEANGNEETAHQAFVTNYRALRDARAEVAELIAAGDSLADQWLLSGGILVALDQVLQQLDIDARVRVRDRWKASQLGRRLAEGQIGPRTTPVDRFRHARMRARSLRPRHNASVVTDFMDDDETTQVIPRLDAETLARLEQEKRKTKRGRLRKLVR